ncbi:recombination associated protein RdgC [Sphaerotilus hippei]|uniref:Recombination-associated protein RdgC n=1 Tax=Sphaerotilus hippei TaxID=744406 RepID=A0A318GZD7_9BURK|nr:recombination-associated protein RdgC [Sphaerotilus hippei]PXW95753.1 recombination associated protein RdgC [Sphaerotilus hippei]
MFKNLILFRVGPDWSASLEQVEAALDSRRFVPCGASQPMSAGWIEPRGKGHGVLVESVGGQWLMKMMVEQKVLPGSVVKRRVDEICAHIEQTEGRKPGRKESKEIKEQATLELLPMAFTKQGAMLVWIDPAARLMVVDASSPGRADDVVTALVQAVDGLALAPIHTAVSPQAAMSEWLVSGEPPAIFTVDRDCELKSTDEMKSVVRYARHGLDSDEVRQHILTQGKVPTRLAMTWNDRVSFLLTDTLQVKKITFLDGVYEGQAGGGGEDEFDADAAIATGELSQLIPDLLDALGGEQAPGSMPALPVAPVLPVEPPAAPGAASADLPPWEA